MLVGLVVLSPAMDEVLILPAAVEDSGGFAVLDAVGSRCDSHREGLQL